ncbi:MAG: cryptochrome/photolyase family protein [Shimia sp.]
MAPTIVWFRRDLRLADHAALTAACEGDGPVIPVFVRCERVGDLATAPAWRLGLGVEVLARSLEAAGSRLVCRAGAAAEVLTALARETGARRVLWSRAYDPETQARDAEVKAALGAAGVEAASCAGHLLFDPWSVETKTGGFYKVYSPFWRAVKDAEIEAPLPAPARIPAPEGWPAAEDPTAWALGAGMRRGANVVRPHLILGEAAARDRLDHFMGEIVDGYATSRDRVDRDGTSRLSQCLSLGEISPRQCWQVGMRALEEGKGGAETFLKELVWREFAYHLLHHTPRIADANWREEWDAFPWSQDAGSDAATAWMRGRTGMQFVDAGLREMYVTGTMHNRARMIVASYLTKHLMTHWRIGQRWFEEHLVDWDPASNAMGWQWSAGSGPDATPFFRVFNPVTQLDKFDPDRAYVSRWIAEGRARPHDDALSYFEAIPERWRMAPGDAYPAPIVAADVGRKRALAAYEARDF